MMTDVNAERALYSSEPRRDELRRDELRRDEPELAAELPPVPARSFEAPTLLDKAISAGLWAAGLGFLVPTLGTMTAVYQAVPSHKVNFLGRFYCWGQIKLTGNRWRAVVHPDVDPNRAYIFAQNHTNHLDHVVLYNATPHFKQGLELESHFDIPVYGWFMRSRGTVPVKKGRDGQTPEVLARIGREIDEGRSILAFPEGTRTRDGRVAPFRKGIFFIARDLGVPIVPVAVTGSFDVLRPGSWILRPGNEITVFCEKPVETAGLNDDEVLELASDVQRTVAARVDAYWRERA